MYGSLLSMLNTKIIKDEALSMWTHTLFPHPLYISLSLFRDGFFFWCYSSVQSTVHGKPIACSMGFLPTTILSMFSCWCFQWFECLFTKPHFVSIKRMLNVQYTTTWNYCKLETIYRLNQLQFDLTRDFRLNKREKERESVVFFLPLSSWPIWQ